MVSVNDSKQEDSMKDGKDVGSVNNRENLNGVNLEIHVVEAWGTDLIS